MGAVNTAAAMARIALIWGVRCAVADYQGVLYPWTISAYDTDVTVGPEA